MPLPPNPIGCDSTVLINFAKVGALELLAGAVPALEVMTAVCHELKDEPCRSTIERLCSEGKMQLSELSDDEMVIWIAHTMRLGAGEAAVLAAAELRGWSVALDDKLARRIASERLGAGRLTGTIGLLIACVECSAISLVEADRMLAKMIEYGFFSPTSTVSEHM